VVKKPEAGRLGGKEAGCKIRSAKLEVLVAGCEVRDAGFEIQGCGG